MSTPINFFGGNPLNRNGPSRERADFMKSSLISDKTKYIAFKKDQVLFNEKGDGIVYLEYQKIKGLLKDLDLYSKIKTEEQNQIYKVLEHEYGIILVYLGYYQVEDVHYWAIQLDAVSKISEDAEAFINELLNKKHEFLRIRPAAFKLKTEEAAIVSQARALLDWHSKNRYCPSCSSLTISGESGYKRVCLGAPLNPNETSCVSAKGIQNFSYPRTDAVGIVCVVSKDGERILLGRKPIFPKGTYSCIAGFFEPGESIEDAIRREVLEETGVVVGNVKYISSQPWPFPSNLMIGCHAQALTEDISKDDEELEDAKWFTRQQVLGALANKNLDPSYWLTPTKADDVEHGLVLPTKHSIAHQLINIWANNTNSHL